MASQLSYDWHNVNTGIRTEPRLRLGLWWVGKVFYDYSTAAERGRRHLAIVTLPGMPENQGYYGTEEEAQEYVERAVRYWIHHLIKREEEKPVVGRISRQRAVAAAPARVSRSRPVAAESTGRMRRSPRGI